ncbi:MAG: putative globular PEP-CTERM protein, partial [Opitutaceae bacterium]|nr:putative globular PEP-CTERM protein [Opitutaceae bacterium]
MNPRSTTIANTASNTASARVFVTLAFLAALTLAFFAALVPTSASAETVTAQIVSDFNDTPTEGRSNLSSDKNYGLGIGYAIEDEWTGGTSVLQVTDTDLSAPESTRYAVVQPATVAPACVWGNYATIETTRQLRRSLAKPLSGTVWGSFLVNNGLADHRTGLTFNLADGFGNNADTASTTGVRWLYAHGADLAIRPNTFAANAITVPGRFTLGVTALVLFSYDTVTQRLKVWINPVLTDDPALLASDTLAYDSGAGTPLDLFGSSGQLTRLGIVVNGGQTSATNAGKIDSIRLDASTLAYYAVTGLPVPPDSTRSAPVIADFNDTSIGQLGSSNAVHDNDNKGIGFSNVKWDGGSDTDSNFSGVLQTGAEDLVAPASTRYAIVQSGPPRCVYVKYATDGQVRGAWRTLTTPLSGEVWGSFLVQNGKTEHRTGLYFNIPGGGGGAPASHRSIIANGTFLVIYNHGGGEVANVENVFTLGKTALVLFRINTATLQVTVWVNPVLPDNAAGLDALTPDYDDSIPFFGSVDVPLDRIGIMATGGQTDITDSASKIDALYLASGSTGYYSVTGLQAKPHITAQPQQSQTLLAGETATFSVAATSQWPLLYQWTHNGTEIPTATTASLTVENITPANAGDYQVLVSHSDGIGATLSSSASLDVTVVPPDGTPDVGTDPAGNITSTGFTASWGAVTGATGYQISISTSETFAEGSFVEGYENLTIGDSLTHAVTGLTAGTQYYYRVRATNDAGAGAWSETVSFATGEEDLEDILWLWSGAMPVPGALAREGYIATHWAGPDTGHLQIYAVSAMLDAYNEDSEFGGTHDGLGWDDAMTGVPTAPGATWISVTRVFQYNPSVFYGTENTDASYGVAVESLDLADLAAFWELIQGTNVSRAEISAEAYIDEFFGEALGTMFYPLDEDLPLTGTPGLIPQPDALTFSGELPAVFDTSATITVGGGNAGDYTLAVVPVVPVVPVAPDDGDADAAVTITPIDATAGTFTVTVVNGSGSYQLIYGRAGAPDGDPRYAYATALTAEITTAKANQATLSIVGENTHTYGAAYTLSTGDSGSGTGEVTYEIVEGGTGAGSINGDQLTITTVGTFKLKATKTADANYNAATSAEFTLTVGKADQATLSITSADTHTYGAAYTIESSGGSGTGAVAYEIVEGGSGAGSINDATLTITTVGTFKLKATKAADANYNAATSAEFTLTVGKAEQATLSITSADTHTYGAAYTITSEGGSGTGAITYEIVEGGTGAGSIDGATLTITTVGTFTLKATKAADANYNAATSAEFTLTVNKAEQTPALAITSADTHTYGTAYTITSEGGSGTGAVTYEIVAGGNGEGSISGNGDQLTITTVGTFTLKATKAADANYNAATSAEFTLTVNKAEQTPALTITSAATHT